MRPKKLTKELVDEICEYIAQGFSYVEAAKLSGISSSTFFRWRVEGQKKGSSTLYQYFEQSVKEASSFSESEALQVIRRAVVLDRNWKAASWFLERRFPASYQRNQSPIEEKIGKSGDEPTDFAMVS